MRAAAAGAGELTSEAFADMLRAHGAAAVVTAEEDRVLAAAGLRDKMPAGWDGVDLWARHRAAGLDVGSYEPLAAE